MVAADVCGKLRLEFGDTRTLGHPSGTKHGEDSLFFFLADIRASNRNHSHTWSDCLIHFPPPASTAVSDLISLRHSTSARNPVSRSIPARKPSNFAAFSTAARLAWTLLT